MKVNDLVKVIAGENKGVEAKIVAVDRKNGRAMLEGIGEIERHMKNTQFNQTGKKSIHVGIEMSNLKLVKAAEYEKKAAKKSEKAEKVEKADKKAKKGAK